MKKLLILTVVLMLATGITAFAGEATDEEIQEQATHRVFAAKHLRMPPPEEMEAKLEDKATEKGMTLEEYKAYLAEQRETRLQEREAKLQEMEAKLQEEATEKGMTLEEYKAYLAKQREARLQEKIQEREAKLAEEATEKGMTLEEYKAYLAEQRETRLQEKETRLEQKNIRPFQKPILKMDINAI